MYDYHQPHRLLFKATAFLLLAELNLLDWKSFHPKISASPIAVGAEKQSEEHVQGHCREGHIKIFKR